VPASRSSLRVRAIVGVAVLALAACAKDEATPATTSTSTTTTTTLDPAAVLATCTPADGSDFVAVEKHHLTNGGQHLGQGFVAVGPDGRYLAANVYSVDNVLLASGLMWRVGADGSAMTVSPEANAFDNLPDVPADQVVAHPELLTCVAAAVAAG
jgi:hypothetical protein